MLDTYFVDYKLLWNKVEEDYGLMKEKYEDQEMYIDLIHSEKFILKSNMCRIFSDNRTNIIHFMFETKLNYTEVKYDYRRESFLSRHIFGKL